MKKLTTVCLASLIGLSGCAAFADSTEHKVVKIKKLTEIAPYPEAKQNQERHVIFLTEKENEENYKVELVIGKNMQIDCNRHTLMGKINQETLKGWGYDYYVVETEGQTLSTRMACPNQEKKDAFVTLAPQELQRYNSKLPIVIYAPKGVDVHYRIWTADKSIDATAQ